MKNKVNDLKDKDEYRAFCSDEINMPIFSKDWWLDAVSGRDNWDVILVKKNNNIIASMPFIKTVSKGFSLIIMPTLTQTLGPYIKYPNNQNEAKRLSFEKVIMDELITKLPDFDVFNQNFNYSITNWLPFYWNSFEQTTKYTYVINNIKDIDVVVANFDRSKKKNIKKAEKTVKIKYDLSAKDFYDNHSMTLKKQGADISYSFELFNSLYKSSYENDSGKIIYAIDEKDFIHGALFIVWDGNSAYDLISTIDPDTRNCGAASLLIQEAIRFVADKTNKFDFEGSMIENVENSFRKFGAVQTPYFSISKTNSKLIHIMRIIKKII